MSCARTCRVAKLPEYMVPSTFMTLERLPLTANNKIDRKALPRPERAAVPANRARAMPQEAVEFTLRSIWEELLHEKGIGVDDSFFDVVEGTRCWPSSTSSASRVPSGSVSPSPRSSRRRPSGRSRTCCDGRGGSRAGRVSFPSRRRVRARRCSACTPLAAMSSTTGFSPGTSATTSPSTASKRGASEAPSRPTAGSRTWRPRTSAR